MIEGRGTHQTLRPGRGSRRDDLLGPTSQMTGLLGRQRRRQDHDATDDPWPRASDIGNGHRRRPALRRPRRPLRHVGSLLDARAVQPGCSATEHLLALARSNGFDLCRVGEYSSPSGSARSRANTQVLDSGRSGPSMSTHPGNLSRSPPTSARRWPTPPRHARAVPRSRPRCSVPCLLHRLRTCRRTARGCGHGRHG
jgi:hypothetical protein